MRGALESLIRVNELHVSLSNVSKERVKLRFPSEEVIASTLNFCVK
jgi:hypothetical protein